MNIDWLVDELKSVLQSVREFERVREGTQKKQPLFTFYYHYRDEVLESCRAEQKVDEVIVCKNTHTQRHEMRFSFCYYKY